MPWPSNFPPLYNHILWAPKDAGVWGLADHPLYISAKKKRSTSAAIKVCSDVVNDETLDFIYDTCHTYTLDIPIVVAPALTLLVSKRNEMGLLNNDLPEQNRKSRFREGSLVSIGE